MAIGKNDHAARALWGRAYDELPKSVFAVVAWYLADCASDEGVGHGGEVRRFIEELDAMKSNGILDAVQVDRALAALAREARREGACA
jgi:hypothetical protein